MPPSSVPVVLREFRGEHAPGLWRWGGEGGGGGGEKEERVETRNSSSTSHAAFSVRFRLFLSMQSDIVPLISKTLWRNQKGKENETGTSQEGKEKQNQLSRKMIFYSSTLNLVIKSYRTTSKLAFYFWSRRETSNPSSLAFLWGSEHIRRERRQGKERQTERRTRKKRAERKKKSNRNLINNRKKARKKKRSRKNWFPLSLSLSFSFPLRKSRPRLCRGKGRAKRRTHPKEVENKLYFFF